MDNNTATDMVASKPTDQPPYTDLPTLQTLQPDQAEPSPPAPHFHEYPPVTSGSPTHSLLGVGVSPGYV